jgi:hypothetical protein
MDDQRFRPLEHRAVASGCFLFEAQQFDFESQHCAGSNQVARAAFAVCQF